MEASEHDSACTLLPVAPLKPDTQRPHNTVWVSHAGSRQSTSISRHGPRKPFYVKKESQQIDLTGVKWSEYMDGLMVNTVYGTILGASFDGGLPG